jgi:DnaJ-class molecular chaperone
MSIARIISVRIERDYYDILNIPPNASITEIKEAYRKLAFQYHPDKNQMSFEANERMKEINVAYDAISDNIDRKTFSSSTEKHDDASKFKMGIHVRINHHSKTYRDQVGVVEKEPVRDSFRYWYMVKIEQKDFSTINRFAEEELEEIPG